MRTSRLPVVDWTDAPADLNGLVRFAERWNLVSARVPSHFKRSLHTKQSSSQVALQLYLHFLFLYGWLHFEISNNMQVSTYWNVRTATSGHATMRKVLDEVKNITAPFWAILLSRPLRYRDRLVLTELSNIQSFFQVQTFWAILWSRPLRYRDRLVLTELSNIQSFFQVQTLPRLTQ